MPPFWQVYEDELWKLCHGHPIWHAEPFSPQQEVHIGDVGYMEEGRFYRVFNAFYGDTRLPTHTAREEQASMDPQTSSPATFRPGAYDAPFPNNYSVPENHIPLTIPEHEVNTHNRIPKGWHYRTDYNKIQVSLRAGMDAALP